MKKIIITITAILLFGNLNAQMVDETDQELMIDCYVLQENIEYDLQQYEVNMNAYIELYEKVGDSGFSVDQLASYNETAVFYLDRSEQFSVIYSAICK